ncbi:MAG: AAA family ATPase [Verrucomicrobiales bacterium]|nr:AAA family ATPase [Verrucomicrobiales bacterium]MCP5526882.1 AAA family ATPase [Verrucomicrobiales bacterium]
MYIQSICLENVRSFKSLEFNLERPGGGGAGWTVFVGGNSSGKTTILRSAALALIGPDSGGRLISPASGWIQRGESKASAKLSLSWDPDHDRFKKAGKIPGDTFEAGVRWLIEEKGDEVPQFRALGNSNPRKIRPQTPERGPWSLNAYGWFSAGYGPMRRLTGSSSEALRYSISREAESRFVTLFREDAALSESEEWLRRMHARSLESESKQADIRTVLDGVQALMGDGLLPHGMKISRITVDHVFVEDGGGLELPMRDISDGCRSIYATILDLVHGLYEVYGADGLFETDDHGRTVIARPGVVIIDEIEAHLHPSWQRDIPEWLKTHFPKIQFLVSTHSPLIAQAADPNGLFILPLQADDRQQARPATPAEYERIRWGTAHKTILGVAFGLQTTRTKWASRQLKRWQELNAKDHEGVPLKPTEKRELKTLKQQLDLALDGAPAETL